MSFIDFFRKKESRIIYPTYSKGFHGDDFLIRFTSDILKRCDYFIETGSAEATTLSFVAKEYPSVKAISCEADQKIYVHAKKQIALLPNAELRNEASPDFLYNLSKRNPEIHDKKIFFWLDAHGYGFKWPLREEVDHIFRNYRQAYVFIDDFKVPGQPQFGYDTYDNQECSLEYLKDVLDKDERLKIYFPKYQALTSDYHPLRGWVLIENIQDETIRKTNDIFLHSSKND